jgi:predicted ribosomally synthesized peptide with SipW-like signal peptide
MGIMAAMLAMALALGGTFMLFTAQSEAATNIVTVGSGFSIRLQERDDTPGTDYFQNIGDDYGDELHYEYGTYAGEKSATFKGLDFDRQVMGARLAKHPRVIRTDIDGADACLRVKAEIAVSDSTGKAVEFTAFSSDEQRVMMDIWYASPVLNSNWLKSDAADGTWYYYYVNDSSIDRPELKIFERAAAPGAPNATQTLYDSVYMPDYSKNGDADLYNAFVNLQGCKISVELTAQAVQSANNAPHDPDFDYADFFTEVE